LSNLSYSKGFNLCKARKATPLGKVCAVAPDPKADEKSLLTPTEKPAKSDQSKR